MSFFLFVTRFCRVTVTFSYKSYNAYSCLDAAEFFVSRTGKTNDPTKIKGWRDKFKTSAGHSAPEGKGFLYEQVFHQQHVCLCEKF